MPQIRSHFGSSQAESQLIMATYAFHVLRIALLVALAGPLLAMRVLLVAAQMSIHLVIVQVIGREFGSTSQAIAHLSSVCGFSSRPLRFINAFANRAKHNSFLRIWPAWLWPRRQRLRCHEEFRDAEPLMLQLSPLLPVRDGPRRISLCEALGLPEPAIQITSNQMHAQELIDVQNNTIAGLSRELHEWKAWYMHLNSLSALFASDAYPCIKPRALSRTSTCNDAIRAQCSSKDEDSERPLFSYQVELDVIKKQIDATSNALASLASSLGPAVDRSISKRLASSGAPSAKLHQALNNKFGAINESFNSKLEMAVGAANEAVGKQIKDASKMIIDKFGVIIKRIEKQLPDSLICIPSWQTRRANRSAKKLISK